MRADFVWDDAQFVMDGPVQGIEGLKQIWTPGVTPQYYPVTYVSLWIERAFFGENANGYHCINILLHFLNSILLWLLLRRLRIPASWLAAAIFALHPVHVESVAWVAERKNVLSGFFYLMSWNLFLKWQGSDPRRRLLYALSLVSFLLALLSKSVTCTLPVAILIMLWWKAGRLERRQWVPLAPYFAVGLVLGLLTVFNEQGLGAKGDLFEFNLLERVLIAGRAWWFYLEKLFYPNPLIFNYPRWDVAMTNLMAWCWPIAAGAFMGMLWACRRVLGRGPFAGLLFFTVTLFPALGFFNVYPFQYSFVADHFQYLASLGPIVVVANTLGQYLGLRPFSAIPRENKFLNLYVPAIILSLLGGITRTHSAVFMNPETLWRDTLEKNPASWMAHNNLAGELVNKGLVKEGVTHYKQVLKLNPTYAKAIFNLGFVAENQGDFKRAIEYYYEALDVQPDYANAHNNLGGVLYKLDRNQEAIEHFKMALEAKPGWPVARKNLDVVLTEERVRGNQKREVK